ncbi:hypothetical protein [Streptomyces griseus]|uniref:hypothetical protein n=1 Tax=Streptomyces griseus TaxID=1911 RepID=UPI0004CBA589|nr:hypothetical protein [Streptomyces griseus]
MTVRPVTGVLRAVVTAHVLAVFGQPVFAGVYLSGDFDGLRRHGTGADVVTSLCLVQLAVAAVALARLRTAWPFWTTLALAAAETAQYFAGTAGALWLHLPLGVFTIAALVLQFAALWIRPLDRKEPADA